MNIKYLNWFGYRIDLLRSICFRIKIALKLDRTMRFLVLKVLLARWPIYDSDVVKAVGLESWHPPWLIVRSPLGPYHFPTTSPSPEFHSGEPALPHSIPIWSQPSSHSILPWFLFSLSCLPGPFTNVPHRRDDLSSWHLLWQVITTALANSLYYSVASLIVCNRQWSPWHQCPGTAFKQQKQLHQGKA